MPSPHPAATAAVVFAALLVAHHLGDHWVQTGHQARHKGDPSRTGQWACAAHVTTYTATTLAAVLATAAALHLPLTAAGIAAGQAFSAVTHYAVDRRWTLALLARRLGKAEFHRLGQPRRLQVRAVHVTTRATAPEHYHQNDEHVLVDLDNPVLGTGAYSLDQSLHLPALFVSALLTTLI